MPRGVAIIYGSLAAILMGCATNSGLSVEEIASTKVAETAAASSPMPAPTSTIPLTATSTNTPEPTKTPVPTNTPRPPTPTPGPAVFFDDFTEDIGAWLFCDVCEWRDGSLFIGPFAPNQFHTVICEPCGQSTYFRMAVDATYSEGQVDRGYGFQFGIGGHKELRFVITTLQIYAIVEFTEGVSQGELLKFDSSGVLNPSRATNHLEVLVEPTGDPGLATITFKINGKTLYTLYNHAVELSELGLTITYHALGVAFENFEFEGIEP